MTYAGQTARAILLDHPRNSNEPNVLSEFLDWNVRLSNLRRFNLPGWTAHF
jgi:hypothetical protein